MELYEKVIFLGKKCKPRSQFFSLPPPPQITIAIKQGFQWLKMLNFSVQSTLALFEDKAGSFWDEFYMQHQNR